MLNSKCTWNSLLKLKWVKGARLLPHFLALTPSPLFSPPPFHLCSYLSEFQHQCGGRQYRDFNKLEERNYLETLAVFLLTFY